MALRRASVVVCCAVAAAVTGAGLSIARAVTGAERAGAAARARAERAVGDQDIAFFVKRVAADPWGAADRARLAALYLQRARETGDYEDYRRAEALARQSLALRTSHNAASYSLLATALLAQHRFVAARRAARRLVALEPDAVSARALLGEIELELGRYGAARSAFDSLWPARHELAVAPRLARWAEIRGDTGLARRLLAGALTEALRRPDLAREQVAWFYLRVGDEALRSGRLDEAESAFRAGLEVFPEDYRLPAALARLASARGRWRDVIAWGDRALAALPDPATFGMVSDAYLALGDTARAEEYARAMEVAVSGQPGQWHRAWSLFLLDHERRVDEVLARVQGELETRRDVYGWDLYAWALHKKHRDTAATRAMARALAQGTRDPQLLTHAAAIARALRDSAAP